MRSIDVSATVERDGELRIRSPELKAGQHVEAKLVLSGDDLSDDAGTSGPSDVPTCRAEKRHNITELRGLFKGTWGSAEAIDRYLREERDAWER